MKREPKWVSKLAVLAIHEGLLAEHGGASGIRDEGLLDSALASPQHHLQYEDADVFTLAAVYAHAPVRNHPFHDGNKRLALTVAGVFLELNGYRLNASEPDAVGVTVALAYRKLDIAGYTAWLRSASVLMTRRSKGKRNPVTKPPPAT